MKIKLFFTLTVFALLAACANQLTPKVQSPLVINYTNFGPPQLSEELIGKYQYSWPDPDNHKPVAYNIHIVIYQEGGLKEAQSTYKTDKSKKVEYRFVEYSKASVWLDEKIDYFEKDIRQGDSENLVMMFPFLQEMYKTSLMVERHF